MKDAVAAYEAVPEVAVAVLIDVSIPDGKSVRLLLTR